MTTTDILVIGGGIAGATAAAHLAPRARVLLAEAEHAPGHHTTGRSAAIWIGAYGPPDAQALSRASRAFFNAPPEGFTEAPLAKPRAVLTLAPAAQAAAMAGKRRETPGFQDVPDPRALVPALREGYAAEAGMEPDCFDMDVAALHQGFLRQVARHGGVIALDTRIVSLRRAGGLWHATATDGSTITAARVVNAAGAWADEVAAAAGEPRIGLQPKRRTAALIPADPWDPAGWPVVADAAHSWYAKPQPGRQLLVSPADETDSPPCDAAPEEYDVALGIARMQEALDVPVRRVVRAWAGLRSFTPDRGLAIGAGRSPGFFWMAGQGGYGIQTSPAAGRLLAALALGEPPEDALLPVLPRLDPTRFPA
ncbi:MAG: NAD(P)/FAD-dependent oxidoreductase [Acetobacteraceae bacterium]